jgi:hypothetical protein
MANSSTLGVEKMNEWMWPRTTVRNFLIDGSAGYGGVTSSFVTMTVTPYGGWMAGTRVRELRTRNESNYLQTGVMAFVQHGLGGNPGPGDPPNCPQFAYPLNAGNHSNNRTYVIDDFDGQYFAYMTMANVSRMWIKQGNCNFSVAPVYSPGSPINITLGSEFYMLYVLNATMQNGDFGAIGLADFNASIIQPIRMENNQGNEAPKWNILSMNLSGIVYNVVFANDTMPYPQAGTWGAQDISKVVWVDMDGNFSDAQRKEIGDVISSGNKYLAMVGPGPWEGILVGDSTNLSGLIGTAKPGLDIKARDNTPVYFGIVNESEAGLDLDLNMDGDSNDSFYLAAFDDFDDGNRQLTRMYIDDDLNITEPWWANSSNPQKDYEDGKDISYYDFYGVELGLAEQEGSPPKGMWGGNIRFAPWNQSIPWEESAEWQIRSYNGTQMLFEKNIWSMNKEKTISLTVKAFDFAQSPIVGANISLVKLMRFGGGQPFKELNATDFTILPTQNATDSKGFGMLKIAPPGGGWVEAEYIAVLNVEYNGKSERTDNWFRIGQMNKGGPK